MARKFLYNGMELADPDASLTPEQVRDIYAIQHAELTTATISGPENQGEDKIFKFQRAIGAKG